MTKPKDNTELKLCTKCNTMKNISNGSICTRCKKDNTKLVEEVFEEMTVQRTELQEYIIQLRLMLNDIEQKLLEVAREDIDTRSSHASKKLLDIAETLRTEIERVGHEVTKEYITFDNQIS